MDEPHLNAVPDQRERVRPRKDKGITLEDRNFVSEDLPLPGWNPGLTPGDGSGTSEAPLPNDLFANLPPSFTTPASLDEASRREVVAEGSRLINEGMRVFNSTLDGSFREARLSHFKAEEIERKFIHFPNERKGRRAIAAELARRTTLFDAEFRSFKDAQDYVGDFRECRGSGTQWLSTDREASSDLYVHQIWTSHTPTLFPTRGREWNPGFTPGDGSGTSEAPLPNDFFTNLPPGFTTPASLDEASRREVVAEGSRLIMSFREARLSHFKAEEIERKFIRFQNEVAGRERKQAESHSRALIRAERKGRRAIAAELERRATLFDAEFMSFKDAQDYVGDFCECRGSFCTLWKSQNADFSFLSEVAEMSGLMDGCAQTESMVPPIEGKIRELWEPIEVLEDTTEAGADAADEGGEVDQPADPFGASISGYLDLDL
ncbi:hypothetical protein F2Q70_00011279 [Brassica cretica]|uniref:Uncharacterized protein n=1 Tax=Brassica cretica TaxID=69181 RepID=A0A8S9LYP5_BRACR|nr:hypothetical protein F2Q70_00011279 [Brassica cretica]